MRKTITILSHTLLLLLLLFYLLKTRERERGGLGRTTFDSQVKRLLAVVYGRRGWSCASASVLKLSQHQRLCVCV